VVNRDMALLLALSVPLLALRVLSELVLVLVASLCKRYLLCFTLLQNKIEIRLCN